MSRWNANELRNEKKEGCQCSFSKPDWTNLLPDSGQEPQVSYITRVNISPKLLIRQPILRLIYTLYLCPAEVYVMLGRAAASQPRTIECISSVY